MKNPGPAIAGMFSHITAAIFAAFFMAACAAGQAHKGDGT